MTCALTLALSLVLVAGNAGAKTRKPGRTAQPAAITTIAPRPMFGRPRMFTINDAARKLDGMAPAAAAFGDAATIAAAALISSAGRTQGNEPFGLFALRAPAGLAWTKWRGVEDDIAVEREIVARCRAEPEHCASPAAVRFIALVDDARRRDGRDRLDAVNRAVNAALRYVSDLVQHGVPDLWSAPLASLAAGAGDCEDYAIAKYEVLREAGVAAEDLRLVVGRDLSIGQDHAVLAVRQADLPGQPDLPGQGGRWLILDSRNATVIADAEMIGFVPILAMGPSGVDLFAVRRVDQSGGTR
jgi:predicted transglutaminase-like cysteine proteinase